MKRRPPGAGTVTAMALLLVVAAGATAHHVYETHLSSSYAPILQAAMIGSYEERTRMHP